MYPLTTDPYFAGLLAAPNYGTQAMVIKSLINWQLD